MEKALTSTLGRSRAALLAPIAALLAAGCGSGEGRSDDELSGLVHAPRQAQDTIAVDKAVGDVGQLLRATALGHAQVGALLGPHTVTGRSHTEVLEKGVVVETIDDEMGIEFDAKGNYHAQVDNSKEYGRDVYFVGGWLYLRPRYGKFHRRRPGDDGEAGRIRGEIYATVGATLDLLAPGVALSDGGKLQVSGRAARLIKLGTAPEPRAAPAQPLTQRKWRESAVVKQVAGEVVLDAKTGVPLRATIQGTISFQRDGRKFEMKLDARHELGTFGGVEEVEAPAAELIVMDTDKRHELDERDSLLEGIAPPAARGRTPGPAREATP
ncbi:MAG TPA: hypothetical protein VK698_25200 [Kofleriaceae bacterium]|nr:hypothetical protein [Kofleriaceae bacterium]